MQFFEKSIPDYLTRKGNLVGLVLFTAVFALAFINIYDPFSVKSYLELSGIRLFLYSSFVILTGILVVVISRLIMYFYSKIKRLNYWRYILWVFAEILVMAFVYSIYVKFILADGRDFMDLFKVTMKNTLLVILLPYTILWLFFSWQDKSLKLQALEEKLEPSPKTKSEMIPFRDEKGTLRLSVQQQDLLYLEAADNYVSIYFIQHKKVQKFMIRNSMKAYEEQFEDSRIIRCHRSYMVNLDKVSIIRKEQDGLHLELGIEPPISLLVTKTYVKGVLEAFSSLSAPES
ncbi:MAG: LytTR family transcriptional regulator DNA-binding domain-containing protein [Bacteroidetes bacterium]|nr:LytTR family transcriptional regulator DNA-binding domain-containing protein [Bacteroidota bacterium]